MKITILLLLYLQDICYSATLQRLNLTTYSLPENRALKKYLGYKEDTYLSFMELTEKYKYPSEEHAVITEDGYVLAVFRIFSKCNNISRPVILMHGLYDSSDEWILNGPNNGLAYILAENCYDVWAANHRGNRYSRRHIKLNPDKDIEFWNFSFDENGYFDVPAIIDYVTNITNEEKVFYVGHSEGTTDFFIAMSLRPDYNSKIHMSVHLAPIAWFKYFNSPLLKIVAQFSRPLKTALDLFGIGELFAKGQLFHVIIEFLCQFAPQEICGTTLAITTGLLVKSIPSETLAVAFGHLLAGVSGKTLAHFGQLILSKRFQRYDEGRIGNMRRYGTETPPNYNVSNIVSPVLLVCGQNDWVSSLLDVKELSTRLRGVVETYIVPNSYWSHSNHVWGIEAPKLVFEKILDHFERYKN